jgi:hypothetical protein
VATLLSDGGKPIECAEPIPGVFLPVSVYDTPGKVREKLRELFPRSHFPGLWVRHAGAFGAGASARVVE